MPREIDIRKWIILGLLILQIVWLGNHMRWVANGEINPWRLGGYAMYTVPNLGPLTRVHDMSFPEVPLEVNMLQYEKSTRLTNYGRTFRCANVPAVALLAFFNENMFLVGKNLVFVISERQLFRNPMDVKRVTKGLVVVTWQDESTFTYSNRFCGTEVIQSATLPGAVSVILP